MSPRLFLLAAASPLCLAVGLARAETVISTTVTGPITTATAASGARDDVRITASGVVEPAGGAGVTLNSDNSVTIEGQVTITDASPATGLAISVGAESLNGSVFSAGLNRTAKSDWNGVTVAGHGSLSWRQGAGRYFARPQVTADYFLFKEDGRKESGGGPSIDLDIEDRSGSELDAFAGVTLGMQWGEESALIWTPEVTLGWRQVAGDGAGVTTARFVAGGPAFKAPAPDLEGGGGVVRLALRGQGQYFDVAVEAGAESHDGYEAHDARLVFQARAG